MPDYPLLMLPSPTTPSRSTLGGGMTRMRFPGGQRQVARLGERFTELERISQSGDLRIQTSPTGYEPEQVLVLETVGMLQEFEAAVGKIEGLDWLTDIDLTDMAPDEDFYLDRDADSALSGRLFLVMFNQRGVEQLLSLWNQYSSDPDGQPFEPGQKKWASLFNQLRSIRRWGVPDRIDATGLREELAQRRSMGEQRLYVELELWFKRDPSKREAAFDELRSIIQDDQGEFIAESVLPDIRYHGVLANVPIVAVEQMFRAEGTRLVRFDHLMFVRPTGQVAAYPVEVTPEAEESPKPARGKRLTGQPVVALLDGFPLQDHDELEGRLIPS